MEGGGYGMKKIGRKEEIFNVLEGKNIILKRGGSKNIIFWGKIHPCIQSFENVIDK